MLEQSAELFKEIAQNLGFKNVKKKENKSKNPKYLTFNHSLLGMQ